MNDEPIQVLSDCALSSDTDQEENGIPASACGCATVEDKLLSETPDNSELTYRQHIDAYLMSNLTIKGYCLKNHLSYDSFKLRLYRDPRYVRRNRRKQPESDTVSSIIPVNIAQRSAVTFKANGFNIQIDDPLSLNIFLKALKDL